MASEDHARKTFYSTWPHKSGYSSKIVMRSKLVLDLHNRLGWTPLFSALLGVAIRGHGPVNRDALGRGWNDPAARDKRLNVTLYLVQWCLCAAPTGLWIRLAMVLAPKVQLTMDLARLAQDVACAFCSHPPSLCEQAWDYTFQLGIANAWVASAGPYLSAGPAFNN